LALRPRGAALAVTRLVLAGSAAVLAAAFLAMAALGDLHAHARAFLALFTLAGLAYGIAALWVVRRPSVGSRGLAGILIAGVLFRIVLLWSEPTLSTDLYRYLWDGRLAAAGISPYRYPPNAPELAAHRDAYVYPRLNHADWLTVYPPGAQLLFAGMARLAPDSALGFKLAMLAFDLLTVGLLAGWLRDLGRPLSWTLLYAWHPLVIVELAGSGHLDAVAIAASVAALWAATRQHAGVAGALLGVGGLVKLYPLLLIPAVWQRRPARAILSALGILAAGYALHAAEGGAALGSLGRYLREESFNGILRAALERLVPGGAARVIALTALVTLALGIAVCRRPAAPARRALWLVGGYLLATPSLFPWYATWMVPLLAVHPLWPWLGLTWAVGLTYAVFYQPVWNIPGWVVVAEIVPLALGLGALAWSRWAPPGFAGRSWPRAARVPGKSGPDRDPTVLRREMEG
jgi:hypothetical protein